VREQITPFQVAIDDRDLADLADRLARTRWPEREPVEDWSQVQPAAVTW
jgi:epoxide hydrolase